MYGVARDANLFLIKYANFFVRSQTGTKKRAEVTAAALTDAFQRIYDAVTVEGIDPTKSVINLSFGSSSPELIQELGHTDSVQEHLLSVLRLILSLPTGLPSSTLWE